MAHMSPVMPLGDGKSDTDQIWAAIRDAGAGGTVTLGNPYGATYKGKKYVPYIVDNSLTLKSVILRGDSSSLWDDDALPLIQSEIRGGGRAAPTIQLLSGGELENVHIAPPLNLPEDDA